MTVRIPPRKRLVSLPGSGLGWWSLGLLAAHALVMVLLGGALAAAGLRNPSGQPWPMAAVLVPALGPAASGITAGLFAVISRGGRSVFVVAPVLIVAFFLLAGVLVPH